MNRKSGGTQEVVLPVTVFAALRRELEKEVGTLPTVHALHHAGYATGVEAASTFGAGTDSVAELHAAEFWDRLRAFFTRRGWGTLEHEAPHPGIGLLTSSDWVEGGDREPDPESSCSFGTGFLSGLLSELAGDPVAVLEVTCRSRGDDACSFAFGSEQAIHELYGRLLEGTDLPRALAAL